MNIAYIGLGSNIEPRKNYLDDAIQKLANHPHIHVQKKSSIYETEPVGYMDQDDFLNMVLEITTTLESMTLLEVCQQIEAQLERKRTITNGPRTIDLDILLYNSENKDLERLCIPHPRLHERAFVLVPLYEIAPNLTLPTTEERIADILSGLPQQERNGVVKWTR